MEANGMSPRASPNACVWNEGGDIGVRGAKINHRAPDAGMGLKLNLGDVGFPGTMGERPVRSIFILALTASLAAASAAGAQIHPVRSGFPPLPNYGPSVPAPPKPPSPIAPIKPFGGPDEFKPFKGVHTDSTRGGLDPYPHKKPRGERSTY